MSSLGKATSLPADFEGSQKLRLWLKKLNDLRAADEIEEDDCRQVRVYLDFLHGTVSLLSLTKNAASL